MKKLTLLLLATSAITITSCKKTYTCQCTVTSQTGTFTGSETYSTKMKKADAEQKCSSGNVSANGVTASCTLK